MKFLYNSIYCKALNLFCTLRMSNDKTDNPTLKAISYLVFVGLKLKWYLNAFECRNSR